MGKPKLEVLYNLRVRDGYSVYSVERFLINMGLIELKLGFVEVIENVKCEDFTVVICNLLVSKILKFNAIYNNWILLNF